MAATATARSSSVTRPIPTVLRSAVDEQYGPFDIIIDDGGHTMEQQIISIETLFPLLSDGGVYLVEDTHTSYWSELRRRPSRPGTFIEWAKDRLDDLQRLPPRGCRACDRGPRELDAVHCYDSVVVLD